MFRVFLFFAILFCYVPLIGKSDGIVLADDYKKNSSLQWNVAIAGLKVLHFNPHDQILDIGSGDGKISAWIAKQTPRGKVVGLDISDKMVLKASSSFHEPNLRFLQGSATAIPFREQFDKVVSFSTLHWVLPQEVALESMKKSLKRGGTMLIVTYGKCPNNLSTLAQRIVDSEKWASFFPHFKEERVYFTLKEYRELIEKVHLKIQSIEEKDIVARYKDKASLLAFIKPLVTFIDHLSPTSQQDFIENIATEMLKNDPPYPDGSIGIHYKVLEVVATKT